MNNTNENQNQPEESHTPENNIPTHPTQKDTQIPATQRSNFRSRLKRPVHLQPKKKSSSEKPFAFGEVSDVSFLKDEIVREKTEIHTEQSNTPFNKNSNYKSSSEIQETYIEEICHTEPSDTEEDEINEDIQNEEKDISSSESPRVRYERVERTASEIKEYTTDHSKYKKPVHKSGSENYSRNRTPESVSQTSSYASRTSSQDKLNLEESIWSKILGFIKALFGGSKKAQQPVASSYNRSEYSKRHHHKRHPQDRDRRHDGKRGGHRYGKNRRAPRQDNPS